MAYIAMNRFRVLPGQEETFETIWRERESRLGEMPGFVEFRMLKGPERDGVRLYISHATWATEEDFRGWLTSTQFRGSHKNAGRSRMDGVIDGPPDFEGFETVLHQTA